MTFRRSGLKKIKTLTFILTVFAVSLTVNHFVSGWTEPSVTPPGGNAPAPVNVSSDAQIKTGDLSVTTLYDTNDSNYYIDLDAPAGIGGVFGGKVGIGTTSPAANLEVAGNTPVNGTQNLSTPGFSDIVNTVGNAFSNLVVGSQINVTNGGTPFIDTRTVINKNNDNQVIVDQKTNWTSRPFSYVKYPQGIKTSGALTTEGTVSFLGDYEGVGGIYVPNMDMLLGGGNDSIFAFRHEDIAGRDNKIMFGNQTSEIIPTMAIDTENHNVGIGTQDPRAALDIVGDEVLISGASAELNFLDTDVGQYNWRIGTGSSDYLGISVMDNPDWNSTLRWAMVFKNNGGVGGTTNVGIGTNNPTYLLDVNGAMRLQPTATVPAVAKGVIYYNSTDDKFKCYQGTAWTDCMGSGAGALPAGVSGQTLRHDGTNWIANSALYNNGTQVGIGTTSPFADSSLHVYKASGWAEMRVQSIDAAGGADTHYVNNAGTNFSVGLDGTGNSGKFRIEQYNGVDWDPRLVINTSGRVGIGRWDPSAMMDVQMSSGNETEGIHISRTANMNFSYLSISDEAFNTVFRVHENSNVGIGVWVPGEKLDVNGNVRALAFLYSSDERLKENIRKLDNPLEKIMELDGVSFDWKYSGERGIGITAQNVEAVFPELVKTDKTSGMKSVEYGNLVAPLIEALKEQQEMIEEQQREIDDLRQMINK